MPQPVWEDLAEFFDPAEFAIEAVFMRAENEIGRVFGFFMDPNEVASLGDFQTDLPGPQFVCAGSDALAVKSRDLGVIDGTTYDVLRDPQHDGSGIAVLFLAEQPEIYDVEF